MMNYQVVTKSVSSQPLAAVRRRVRIGEVGKAWGPALDLVWEFSAGMKACGRTAIIASFTITLREAQQKWSLLRRAGYSAISGTPAK